MRAHMISTTTWNTEKLFGFRLLFACSVAMAAVASLEIHVDELSTYEAVMQVSGVSISFLLYYVVENSLQSVRRVVVMILKNRCSWRCGTLLSALLRWTEVIIFIFKSYFLFRNTTIKKNSNGFPNFRVLAALKIPF